MTIEFLQLPIYRNIQKHQGNAAGLMCVEATQTMILAFAHLICPFDYM